MPDLVLRTQKTYDAYMKFIADGFLNDGCNLCKASSIKEFKYWKVMDNRFPWSQIAETHHMIIPKRHIVYEELNEKEKKEYDIIKIEYLDKEYDMITEATNKKKTIPTHMHLHLIILKK
jgi:diadenosine tetraphosphate (Ap4A) HIT family hydrolase